MSDHWSDKKPHPFDESYAVPLGPFKRCAKCGFGPNHPLHVPVEERKAA